MATPAHPANAIAITARGLVSSLGHDVVTSCAAARAGLADPEPLDYFPLRGADGGIEAAVGHPVRDLTLGFEGFARLLRLAQAGLADLERQAPEGPFHARGTGFYLSLPDAERIYRGTALLVDDEEGDRPEEPDGEPDGEAARDQAQRLLAACAALQGWPYEPTLRFATARGHTGVAEAVAAALADLAAGRVTAAVVGGVDSLLEAETLQWLAHTGRLKSPDAPVGLLAGEAAGFLLLEPAKAGLAAGRSPLGIVRSTLFGDEPRPLLSGDSPLGAGLSRVLQAIAADPGTGDGRLWLVADLNGEEYRAKDWGLAMVRASGGNGALSSAAVHCPVESFGDTGAASGAVGLCAVTSAFARGYAPAATAAVVSAGDGKERAAIVVAADQSRGGACLRPTT
jgi:3-oxoacyl-[acyl-carrier-protein] synthase I